MDMGLVDGSVWWVMTRKFNDKCEVCGVPLRKDNLYGVCNTKPGCRRVKSLRRYYRNLDGRQELARKYVAENKDEINKKNRERYAKNKHGKTIYLAWSPGLQLCKIGKTSHLKSREKALRNACPDIQILSTYTAITDILERQLHAKFAFAHIRGEWFNLGPDTLIIESQVTTAVKELRVLTKESRP